MGLKAYFSPLLRWWWLLVIATLVAAVSSFLATTQQPPIYISTTTLMIGRTMEDPNPTSGQIFLAQQLASTYADIANREPVRNDTMEVLGLTWLPQYLARALPNSQLIEIRVTDTSPERAQAVANELANQVILRSPTSIRPEDQDRLEFINEQLDTLQTQIKETQSEIEKLQEQLGELNSARQIADSQTQIAALETKLRSLQTNYANLLSNTQRGATNTITVIESAELPTIPVGPNKLVSVALAAAIGFVLAAGAAYLLEYLDNTIRTPEEITQVLQVPVLGAIANREESEFHSSYIAKHPRSQMAEAFRSLRTNIEFAGVDKPLRSILVTSAGVSEGKTAVAVNLAVIMAQGGKKVIILDADLRKPNVHNYLELSNHRGLSDIFRGSLDLHDAIRTWEEENIICITGGSTPPNPAELIGSKKMDNILERLDQLVDVIIIDAPPLLVTDAAVLAAKVDGVLFVVRHGHTPKDRIQAAMELLHRGGAKVIGVALNRIPRNGQGYYAHYKYSGYYGIEETTSESTDTSKSGDS